MPSVVAGLRNTRGGDPLPRKHPERLDPPQPDSAKQRRKIAR